jgi:hypothetical protein
VLEDRCVPAQVFDVTSPADNANQMGTLRWAVDQAQNGDVIAIQTSQPIVLTHGELYLAHDETIFFQASSFGASQATISGGHRSRIFEVAPTAHVNLYYLNLIDGIGVANNPLGTQSADGYGGAILNQGTLTLAYCTLSNNGSEVNSTGSPPVIVKGGGGIYNNADPGLFHTPGTVGELAVYSSDVNGNSAYFGGGIENHLGSVGVVACNLLGDNAAVNGGALENDFGIMVVASSDLDFNFAGVHGGGLDNTGGKLYVLTCKLQANLAVEDGGGIDNNLVSNNSGILLAIDCSFIANKAGIDGGGIANAGEWMSVLNCTFDDNSAVNHGGAIGNVFGRTAWVETSKLIDNAAGSGGGIFNDVGSVLNLGFSWLQTNVPDNLNSPGTYNDLGGNTFI